MLLNEHRKRALKSYWAKAQEPGRFGKIIRDPAMVSRALLTFIANRNLRTVPPEELLQDAEDAIHALSRLVPQRSDDVASWLPLNYSADTDDLASLLNKHRSDKADMHDYHEVYGAILASRRNEPIRILEVGLGTDNLDVQSNMGVGANPGASLRAFRDWAPKSDVIGADIDQRILFTEERIKTYFVDQTKPDTLAELARVAGNGFHLIIDDGLHLPHANFNTIEALLPLLTGEGMMVVEDIDPIHLHYWRTASAVLSDYDTCLCERRGGWLFLLRAKSSPTAG